MEQSPQIKNWDYISEDVEYLQQKYFNKNLIGQNTSSKIKESQDVIENFIYTSDKETRVNYLVGMRPGAYRKVFKMSQNDLFDDIIGVLDETYNSYKNNKSTSHDNENKSEEILSKDNNAHQRNDAFVAPEKINQSIFRELNSNDDYSSNNNIPSYKKYMDNNSSNNHLNNLSLNKGSNYDSSKQKISRKSSHPKYYSGNNNSNYYSKPYISTNNYQNYSNYSRKEDIFSNSSYLMRKTYRDESKSSSEAIKDDYNYYHKRANKNYDGYDERRYYGKYNNNNRYGKVYDSKYDKKGYKDYDNDNSSYNNNQSNEFSNRYDERMEGGRGRNRDFYKERNSYRDRSKSESPKNKYKMSSEDNKGKYRVNNECLAGKDYLYNYPKENYREYKIYSQNNRDNYSGRNYNNETFSYNDNRYSSKYNYDNGYYKKRYLNENKYKGISSNDVLGKYSDRQQLSRSKNRNSRSRSKSWERGNSRYINKDVVRRGRSSSNSIHKFNDNYEG